MGRRVSRVVAKSESYGIDLLLDVNTQIFPLAAQERFTLVVASKIRTDGTACDGAYDQSRKPTLADDYDYAMHGIVYRVDHDADRDKRQVYISFGGLLMRLDGDATNLDGLELDASYYLVRPPCSRRGAGGGALTPVAADAKNLRGAGVGGW